MRLASRPSGVRIGTGNGAGHRVDDGIPAVGVVARRTGEPRRERRHHLSRLTPPPGRSSCLRLCDTRHRAPRNVVAAWQTARRTIRRSVARGLTSLRANSTWPSRTRLMDRRGRGLDRGRLQAVQSVFMVVAGRSLRSLLAIQERLGAEQADLAESGVHVLGSSVYQAADQLTVVVPPSEVDAAASELAQRWGRSRQSSRSSPITDSKVN